MKTVAGERGRVGGKGRKERRVKAGKEYGEGGGGLRLKLNTFSIKFWLIKSQDRFTATILHVTRSLTYNCSQRLAKSLIVSTS